MSAAENQADIQTNNPINIERKKNFQLSSVGCGKKNVKSRPRDKYKVSQGDRSFVQVWRYFGANTDLEVTLFGEKIGISEANIQGPLKKYLQAKK